MNTNKTTESTLIALGNTLINLSYITLVELKHTDTGNVLSLTVLRNGPVVFQGEEAQRYYDLLLPYCLGRNDAGSTRADS